jgi:CRP-like cAMP-binding protein
LIFEKLNLSDKHSAEFFQDISKLMNFQEFSNKHVLHTEGEVCDKIYIIHKGIARAYYYKEGKDITAHFAVENTSITAIDSFIQRKKSRYNIELLEDTSLSFISYNEWQNLLTEKSHYEKYARIFLENIYIDIAERIEDLLFHTAKERYDKITVKFPNLLQRVNLGHIASYIGITQETLSRIRAEK